MRPIVSLWRLFQSRTLALVLLLIIFVAVILASVMPQQESFSYASWQAANPQLAAILKLLLLDRVYSSWWFYLVVGFLLVNTLACTIGRIPPLLRQRQSWTRLQEDQIKGLKNWTSVETPLPRLEINSLFHRRLGKHGYRTNGETSDGRAYIFARKGELAQWGSLLFHFSFLLMLGGVIFVLLTRYVGTMVITEGQAVTEQSQDYLNTLRLPLIGMQHQGFQVGLDGFTPTYEQGMTGADFAADLVVLENGEIIKKQTVRVTQPLIYKGVSFLLDSFGFAPFFVLKDENGEELFSGYVNLSVLPPGQPDSFAVPGTNFTLVAGFYPDMIIADGHLASRSFVPLNPVFSLNVTEAGNGVFTGQLPLGGNVTFGGKSLAFSDLSYWTSYKVVRDPGKDVVFAAFWLGLLGLLIRYLVTPKHIWVLVQDAPHGSHVVFGGTAPQQDALFAGEFARLVQELTRV